MRSFNIGGKEVNGELMEFTPINEPLAVYQLKDGTYLRAKTVVMKVIKLDDKDPIDGSTRYFCMSQFVVSTDE